MSGKLPLSKLLAGSYLILSFFGADIAAQDTRPHSENETRSYSLALELLAEGKDDKAIDILRQMIVQAPTFGHAYRKLVEVYVSAHEPGKAQNYLEALIEDSGENGFAYFGLGLVYEKRQNYSRALWHYKKARLYSCPYGPLYSGLALTFAKMDSGETGIRYFERRIEEDSTNALPYFGVAELCRLRRERQKALAYYEKAVQLAPGLLEAYKGKEVVLTTVGQFDEAIRTAFQGKRLARQHSDVEFEGRFLNGLGVSHWYKSEYRKALRFYQEALAVFKVIGDQQGMARQFGNMAIIYESFGDYARAVEYYLKSLQIAKRMGARKQEGSTLGNLAIAYVTLARYAEATNCYLEAIKTAQEFDDQKEETRHLMNLGVLRQTLGDYHGAKELYHHALQLAIKINYRFAVPYVWGMFGELNAELGLYPEALGYFQKSLAGSRDLKDRRGEAVRLLYIGYVYEMLQEYPNALNHYEQALGIAREVGQMEDEMNALNGLGSTYLKMKQVPQARAHFERAVELGKKVQDPQLLWQAHTGLAEVFWSRNIHEKAFEQLELAIKEVEAVRNTMFAAEESAGFFHSKVRMYERIVDLLMAWPETMRSSEAFLYAEKAKARGLLDLVNVGRLVQNSLQIPDSVKQELLETATNLEDKRNEFVALQNENPDGSEERVLQLKRDIFSLENQYEKLLTELRNRHPNLEELLNPLFVTIDEIQQTIIADNQALLEYFVTDSNVYVWLMTRHRQKAFALNLTRNQVRDKLAQVGSVFQSGVQSPAALLTSKETSLYQPGAGETYLNYQKLHELYMSLLRPVLKHGLPEISELIIVPDDILFYLPFEALITTEFSETNVDFLLESYAISYSPSSSLMRRTSRERTRQRDDLLAVGIAHFAPAPASGIKGRLQSLLDSFRHENLVDLPFAEQEATDIAKNFRGRRR